LATASVGDVETAEIVLGTQTEDVLGPAHRSGLVRLEGDGSLSLHPLLGDLLLERVRKQKAPRRDLVDRFVPLVEGERWDEALSAAEAIPDPAFVSLALESALPELLRSGRATTLRRWVAAGRKAKANDGLVDYAEAELALRDADFARAIAFGENAAESLEGDLKARAHLAAGRASNLTDRADHATRHFCKAERAADSGETLSAALWGKFLQAVDDENRGAVELLRDFEQRSPRDSRRTIRSMIGRIRLAGLDGPFATTVDEAGPVLELLRTADDPLSCTAFLNGYSGALSVLGRYHEALDAADLEIALASEHELEFVRRHATLNRARALIGLRQIAQAERCLVNLDGVVDEADVFLSANRLIERARLQITVGDLEKALAHLFFAPDSRLNSAGRAQYLALRGIVLAGVGRFDEARMAVSAAPMMTRYVDARALARVATALADLGAGEKDQAATVGQVFEGASRTGGLDAIVLACRTSSLFATQLATNAKYREPLATLLARSNDFALARRVGLSIPRAARRTALLSPREREVHELIAQGRTNREIALTLYISESTAKLHVRHIFEKLGVRSRVEAVRAWPPNEDRDNA
jgi:DNA-binding CsgD family transcriptional regulator/tetratricopeptide (TPR) repeat protein